MSPEPTHPFNFRDEGCPYLDMRDMEGRTSLDTMKGYPELAKMVKEPIRVGLGLS